MPEDPEKVAYGKACPDDAGDEEALVTPPRKSTRSLVAGDERAKVSPLPPAASGVLRPWHLALVLVLGLGVGLFVGLQLGGPSAGTKSKEVASAAPERACADKPSGHARANGSLSRDARANGSLSGDARAKGSLSGEARASGSLRGVARPNGSLSGYLVDGKWTTERTAVKRAGVAGVPFPALAVVISGQVSRFIYKDSLAHLSRGFREVLGCKGGHADCRGTVDVYVVLSKSNAAAWSGTYVPPPYLGDVLGSPEKVRDYYLSKNANRFSLRVYSQEEIAAMLQTLERDVAAAGSRATGASPTAFRMLFQKFGRRWAGHRGMYLLRHLAYMAALEGERSLPYNYSHFLVLREDTAFVRDPDFGGLLCRLDNCRRDRPREVPKIPTVLVDQNCGFGSFSDKLWLANRGAADILFAPSDEDHARRQATLLLGGSYMSRRVDGRVIGFRLPPEEWLQSEYFYQYLLETAGARVEKVEFFRTDLRYSGTGLCIPHLYAECTPRQKLYRTCT